jgi:hypothetical protein
MGLVERWSKSKRSYVWYEGYQQPNCFPWMTRAECVAEAKAQGVKAVFQEIA